MKNIVLLIFLEYLDDQGRIYCYDPATGHCYYPPGDVQEPSEAPVDKVETKPTSEPSHQTETPSEAPSGSSSDQPISMRDPNSVPREVKPESRRESESSNALTTPPQTPDIGVSANSGASPPVVPPLFMPPPMMPVGAGSGSVLTPPPITNMPPVSFKPLDVQKALPPPKVSTYFTYFLKKRPNCI